MTNLGGLLERLWEVSGGFWVDSGRSPERTLEDQADLEDLANQARADLEEDTDRADLDLASQARADLEEATTCSLASPPRSQEILPTVATVVTGT